MASPCTKQTHTVTIHIHSWICFNYTSKLVTLQACTFSMLNFYLQSVLCLKYNIGIIKGGEFLLPKAIG